jgi:hypothetical protein
MLKKEKKKHCHVDFTLLEVQKRIKNLPSDPKGMHKGNCEE